MGSLDNKYVSRVEEYIHPEDWLTDEKGLGSIFSDTYLQFEDGEVFAQVVVDNRSSSVYAIQKGWRANYLSLDIGSYIRLNGTTRNWTLDASCYLGKDSRIRVVFYKEITSYE